MAERDIQRPNFLVLGAPKCGTTSLAFALAQHPDVFFSTPKEPVFFEAEYERGLEHYWTKYYTGWQGERAIGEGRTWHLYLPFVPARIRSTLPDARLVAILRDPVERAFSHWWHRYSWGQEPLSFEAAVTADQARIAAGEDFAGEDGAERWRTGLYGLHSATHHRALLDLGFYAEQLERYRGLYPDSQLEIVFYEEVSADLPGVLRRLFAHLRVDPDAPVADLSPQNVKRQSFRSPVARRLLFAIRSLHLQRLVPKALRPRLHVLAERPAERPKLPPELRKRLVDYFEPHTERLERLTRRDLSSWRRTDPL